MSDQADLEINDESKVDSVETYKFEPIKGYPMLQWKGKRPFTSTQYYPAQLKENHGEPIDGWMNRIYWGDNLQVMSHLLKEFRGKVDLVYIDPPFDSKADYKKQIRIRGKSTETETTAFQEKQYSDMWVNDGFLQFIYERLVLIRELLSEKGTLFLHLDPNTSHYAKIILDDVFGRENFRNEIIWRNTNSHNSATTQFGPIHQVVLFYSKTKSFPLHPGRRPYSKNYIESRFKHNDARGRYQTNYLTGPGLRKGESGQEWGGYDPSQGGRHWAIPSQIKKFLPNEGSGLGLHECLDALLDEGLILFPKKEGGQPMYKQYIGEGVLYQDVWAYQPNTQGVLHESDECIDEDVKWLEQEDELTGYPTQKPTGLVKRIIQSCSKEGDLVFDCFMGSGTTPSAAMSMGRRFIGADINLGAVQTTAKRLIEEVANGTDEERAGFSVFNVNHYDVFRNPVEAKELLIEALEIQPLPSNALYDGEKDGRMVKMMPVNRIATKADLNPLITGFDYKSFQKTQEAAPNKPVESLLLICMGHEPDLAAHLKKECPFDLDVEVVDILRNKANLEFKRDSEAEIVVEKGRLKITAFYPMNLLQKLSLQKEKVADWRELTESVMIDWNYDGGVFEPTEVDVPKEKDMVAGEYGVPKDSGTIRVKITDLLSESLEMEVPHAKG